MTYPAARFDGATWERWREAGAEAEDASVATASQAAASQAAEAATSQAAASIHRLTIVTWNVWFAAYQFEARAAALLAELARRRADVIALQEVTHPLLAAILDEPWVRAAYQISELDVLGYDVAVLSRVPIVQLTTLELPTEMGRRLLVARLACGLDVATVHLESTRGCADARAEQLRIIQPFLAGAGEDAVLVGDMNFEPGAPLETAALDPAFVDVWPALRPDDPGWSIDSERNPMRSQSRGKQSQKRIDRVFARTRRWRPAAIELCGTAPIDDDDTFISDHFGLEVKLRRT